MDILHFARKVGVCPDPVQSAVLTSPHPRLILNCCRQWGKTTVTSIKAAHHALFQPGSTVLIASPTERQSTYLVNKCAAHLRALDIPVKFDNRHHTALKLTRYGSQIIGLPNQADTIRGFTVDFLIVDEAARVPDELFTALRPMLITTGGNFWMLSTPNGRRGFFFDHSSRSTGFNPSIDSNFQLFTIPADQCPRISPALLEQERREMPPQLFAQEYLCSFGDSAHAVFPEPDIRAALHPEVPVFTPAIYDTNPRTNNLALHSRRWFIGLDLGQRRDHSALTLLEYHCEPTGRRDPVHFRDFARSHLRLRWIEQFPLGTSYLGLIEHVTQLTRHSDLAGRVSLVFDATRDSALWELLARADHRAHLVPVIYTSGGKVNHAASDGGYRVPKSLLIAALQQLLHTRQLHIAGTLPTVPILTRELSLFERQLSDAGRESFSPAHASAHDDLLNSTALAAWFASHQFGPELRRSREGTLLVPGGGPLW